MLPCDSEQQRRKGRDIEIGEDGEEESCMDLGETERADILDHMKSRMEGSRLQQPRNERSSSLWIHRLQLRDLSLENNNKRVF